MGHLSAVYDNDELSGKAKAVYMYLLDRANSKGECWPAIPTICRQLSLSRSTVQRACKELERRGLLTRAERWRENGGRSSNLYLLPEKDNASRPGRSPP